MTEPVHSSARIVLPFLVLSVLFLSPSCSAEEKATDEGRSAMEIRSSAFAPESKIPLRHTCDGEDLSPQLSWSGVPDGVESFVLIMDDPDAPPGTWVHWLLYDLPADIRELPEGLPRSESLDGGGIQGMCWGVDSFSRVGYYGPCPPPGLPHRYSFRLYALGARLGLPAKATKNQVLDAMKGQVLAEAELVGLYGR
jgi:Raf kinase inhibitor-like YbhB/YbcL family protein